MAKMSERDFRIATRRRRERNSWGAIAAELGWPSPDALAEAFDAKWRIDAGARNALRDRPSIVPSIAIGETAEATHQSRGATARKIAKLRAAERDPLDALIHPSVLGG